MIKITPVILCGGSGTRLWPQSRTQSPKQFQPTGGPGSLTYFQATIQRHRGARFNDPVVVTGRRHTEAVYRQLQQIQCDAKVMAEPVARNTGPAVLAAAMRLHAADPDAIMLVLPADHVIKGPLNTYIEGMAKAANDGRIVIFGIKPTYPETGYGYILDGGQFDSYKGLHSVSAFEEKPALKRATELLITGVAFWASGISMFRADTIIEEFERLDPLTAEAVALSLADAEPLGLGELLSAAHFAKATNEPTERIIFERSAHVAMAPADVEWNDVGSWTSVHEIGDQDAQGNVLEGDVIAIDTENALVKSDKRLVAVLGLNDVIVIDTPDAVLVTRRGACQGVKGIVEGLKGANRREAEAQTEREFFWGKARRLSSSSDYQMSMLNIIPGGRVHLDPQAGQRLVAMHADLVLFDGLSRRKLAMGDTITLGDLRMATVTNIAADAGEVLLISGRSDPINASVQDELWHA